MELIFMLEKCMVVTILNYFTMLSPRGKEEHCKHLHIENINLKYFYFFILHNYGLKF